MVREMIKIISSRIWERLKQEEVTLKKMCQDLDLSYDTIKQNIREGSISKENFNKIAKYLGGNPLYLRDESITDPLPRGDYFTNELYVDAYPIFCEWLYKMIPELTQYALTNLTLPESLQKFVDESEMSKFDFEDYADEFWAVRYPFSEFKSDFENIQNYFGDGITLESYLMNKCLDTIDGEIHKFKAIKTEIYKMHQDGQTKEQIAEQHPGLLDELQEK